MKWRSTALWPKGVHPKWLQITTDDLDSESLAHGINHGLDTHGYGGHREFFPIKTAVDPIDDLLFYAEEIFEHMKAQKLIKHESPTLENDTMGFGHSYAFLPDSEKAVYRAMAQWHIDKLKEL